MVHRTKQGEPNTWQGAHGNGMAMVEIEGATLDFPPSKIQPSTSILPRPVFLHRSVQISSRKLKREQLTIPCIEQLSREPLAIHPDPVGDLPQIF